MKNEHQSKSSRTRIPKLVSSFVGREREIRELDEVLDRVLTQKTQNAATIIGNPGVGKTRLVSEFIRRNVKKRASLRSYMVSARKNESPYYIINRLLRSRFGMSDGADSEAIHREFRSQVSLLLGDKRVTEFLHFLGKFLELKFPESPFIKAVESNPNQREEISRIVLKNFFEIDGRQQPMILVFEDLHLAHNSSLEIIKYLIENIKDAPIMLLCVSQPALSVKNPDWFEAENHHHTRIEIGPLSRGDSEILLGNLLQSAENIPEDIIEISCDMAGGNPFFLEQVVRMYLENNTIRILEDGTWKIDLDNIDTTDLPLTVEDAVQARIASLTPAERKVLEQAAVVGPIFWLGALVAIERTHREPPVLWGGSGDIEPHMEDTLEGLVERDYLIHMPDSTFVGDQEFAFKHNLEREMIRNTVSPVIIKTCNATLAQWLEYRVPEHNEEFVDMLASSYEKGGDFVTAGRYYLIAASAARDRYSNRKSIEYSEKGLELIGEHDLVRKVDALHDIGDVLQRIGELDLALTKFREMQQISWKLDMKAKGGAAHNRIGRVHRESGRLDEALRHLGTGLALFDSAKDQRGVASSLDDIGKVHWMRGDYDLALRQMREALAIRRQLGDLRSIALSLNNLGLVHHDSGRFKDAFESLTESLALRREIQDLSGQISSLNHLGTVFQDSGDNERSVELWQEALRIAKRIDDRVFQATLLINIGTSQYLLGWFEDAIKTLSTAEEIAVQIGDLFLVGESLRSLAETHMHRGDVSKGREYAIRALRQFEMLKSKVHIGIALRTMGEVTAVGGWGEDEIEKAKEHFVRSIEILDEIGNERELARSCRSFADLLSQAGDIENSEKYKNRAEEIFNRLKVSSVL